MSLKKSGNFYVGQVPGTSHVPARPKKHTCERSICPSLSRPFADGTASSLFVVAQSILDVIRIPGTTVRRSSLSSFFPLFLVFHVGWFFENKKVLEEIILFAAACGIFTIKFACSFVFLSLLKYMHQGRIEIVLYQRCNLFYL